MRQEEVGLFPGPTHPHRNPQAPPWQVVVPWGKINSDIVVEHSLNSGYPTSVYTFLYIDTLSL